MKHIFKRSLAFANATKDNPVPVCCPKCGEAVALEVPVKARVMLHASPWDLVLLSPDYDRYVYCHSCESKSLMTVAKRAAEKKQSSVKADGDATRATQEEPTAWVQDHTGDEGVGVEYE